MIAIDRDGRRHEGHISRFMTGWNLQSYTLDPSDVRWLCQRSDDQLVACVRQLDARTHRVPDVVAELPPRRMCGTCGHPEGYCGQC